MPTEAGSGSLACSVYDAPRYPSGCGRQGPTSLPLPALDGQFLKKLGIGPADKALDREPAVKELPFLDLPTGMSGRGAKRRAFMERCKPCHTPHDGENMPLFILVGRTNTYIPLNNFTAKPLPSHRHRTTYRRRSSVSKWKILRGATWGGIGDGIAVLDDAHTKMTPPLILGGSGRYSFHARGRTS